MPTGDPTEQDQEIIDLAGESASEEDLETAAEVTGAALQSKDPRARLAAVEMLSALGRVGISDLCEFLTDEHPEVANLAADRYELEVQNVVNDADRTELVKQAYDSFSGLLPDMTYRVLSAPSLANDPNARITLSTYPPPLRPGWLRGRQRHGHLLPRPHGRGHLPRRPGPHAG